MKKWLVLAAVLGVSNALTTQAQAFCPHVCWSCPPAVVVCPPPCVVTTYRPEWRQEKVPCLIPKVTWREQVDKVPCDTLVPRWDQEKRAIWTCTHEPKNVVYNVPRCRLVPCVWVDPCTCCPMVTCRPEWYVEQVPGVVMEPKWVQSFVMVPVCRWETRREIREVRRCVPVVTQEKGYTLRSYCVMVPCQTVVNPCCPPPVHPVHHHQRDEARFMWYLNW